MSIFTPATDRLFERFAPFRPRIATEPLADFSRMHRGVETFCEVCPTTLQEVSGIVQLAAGWCIPLRTRGCGHALNGSSLPRDGELVVHTGELTGVELMADGTAVAGAGAVLWSVDARVREKGYALPVMNDGYPGPSVGGYVAAGGFGPGSMLSGGFWNNVAELTIVNGLGGIQRVPRDAPLFPWLFGSMGQLGIVVEARLDLSLVSRPLPPAPPVPSDEAGRLFWFTLFVPEESLNQARLHLDVLERRHPETFAFRDRYTYLIKGGAIAAPLIWPHPGSWYALGSWGILENSTPNAIEKVLAFDADFTVMALSNGYGRYVQSEVPSGPGLYERCFGAGLYSRFRVIKQSQDPHHLFNRGWVFGYTNT